MHNRVITEQAPCVKLWTSSGLEEGSGSDWHKDVCTPADQESERRQFGDLKVYKVVYR